VGCLFFGYLLLATQKKVTRPPGGTGYENQHPRSGFHTQKLAPFFMVNNRTPCGFAVTFPFFASGVMT
jgi:hypothetical protein